MANQSGVVMVGVANQGSGSDIYTVPDNYRLTITAAWLSVAPVTGARADLKATPLSTGSAAIFLGAEAGGHVALQTAIFCDQKTKVHLDVTTGPVSGGFIGDLSQIT